MTEHRRLSNLKVVEVGQLAGGPESLLAKYLKDEAKEFTFIETLNAFYYKPGMDIIRITRYNVGTRKKHFSVGSRWSFLFRFGPARRPLLYAAGFLLVLYYTLRMSGKTDIYIFCNIAFPSAGFILRFFRLVKKIIYVSEDHFIKRELSGFDSLVHRLFRALDIFSYNRADVVWYQAGQMLEVKQKEGIIRKSNIPRIKVPIGVDTRILKKVMSNSINRHSAGYVGAVSERMGLGLAIDSLADVKKKIPDVKLVIVGSGAYLDTLKEKVRQIGIENNVDFRGFMDDKNAIAELLSTCAVSLALYEPGPDAPIRFADPAKIKEYFEFGTPVITTPITDIAAEINDSGAGFAVDYTREAVAAALLKLLTDDSVYEKCRRNILRLAEKYEYSRIYDKAFRDSGYGGN